MISMIIGGMRGWCKVEGKSGIRGIKRMLEGLYICILRFLRSKRGCVGESYKIVRFL